MMWKLWNLMMQFTMASNEYFNFVPMFQWNDSACLPCVHCKVSSYNTYSHIDWRLCAPKKVRSTHWEKCHSKCHSNPFVLYKYESNVQSDQWRAVEQKFMCAVWTTATKKIVSHLKWKMFISVCALVLHSICIVQHHPIWQAFRVSAIKIYSLCVSTKIPKRWNWLFILCVRVRCIASPNKRAILTHTNTRAHYIHRICFTSARLIA